MAAKFGQKPILALQAIMKENSTLELHAKTELQDLSGNERFFCDIIDNFMYIGRLKYSVFASIKQTNDLFNFLVVCRLCIFFIFRHLFIIWG